MGNCCSMGKRFNYAKRVSSRDLLCNTIPVVNNTLLCTVKDVKRLAPMFKCSYHSHTHAHTHKRKVFKVVDKVSALLVVMVLWVCAYVQTHQNFGHQVQILYVNYASVNLKKKSYREK